MYVATNHSSFNNSNLNFPDCEKQKFDSEMTMKRSWDDDREIENLAMANCLMLLSKVGESGASVPDRVFHCKTCNKQFQSFQALGGHRASHKRPKITDEAPSPPKPKTHECSICGVEFAIGQALGGHMRRHRDVAAEKSGRQAVARPDPVVNKLDGGKRRVCLDLDLNLTPYENDLKIWSKRGVATMAV